jgi:hypothetical protein
MAPQKEVTEYAKNVTKCASQTQGTNNFMAQKRIKKIPSTSSAQYGHMDYTHNG